MLFLILFIITIIVTLIGIKFERSTSFDKEEFGEGLTIAGALFSIIFFVVGIITFFTTYHKQIETIEKLNTIKDEITVYQKRSNDIKVQVADILIEKYQLHESDIIKAMSDNSAAVYLVKYPELHTHETFKQYADILIQLDDQIYNKEIEEINLKRELKIRKRSIFTIGSLLPTN
jgi:hypothetical protein